MARGRTRTAALAALALAGALAVTNCTSQGVPPPSAPSAPGATVPREPTTEPEVEPEPAVVVPEVGTTVPADQVDAIRDAGGHVYVSPNGSGEGVIVEPGGAVPEALVADIRAAIPTTPPATMADLGKQNQTVREVRMAAQDAGVSALLITHFGIYGPDGSLEGTRYTIDTVNVDKELTYGKDFSADTKDGALANAQAIFDAYPGIEVIDTTT